METKCHIKSTLQDRHDSGSKASSVEDPVGLKGLRKKKAGRCGCQVSGRWRNVGLAIVLHYV